MTVIFPDIASLVLTAVATLELFTAVRLSLALLPTTPVTAVTAEPTWATPVVTASGVMVLAVTAFIVMALVMPVPPCR